MVLEKKNVVFFCRLFFVICGLFLFCLEHFKGLADTLYAIFEKKKDALNWMNISWKQINLYLKPTTSRGYNLSQRCPALSICIYFLLRCRWPCVVLHLKTSIIPSEQCLAPVTEAHFHAHYSYRLPQTDTVDNGLFGNWTLHMSIRNDSHLNVSSHLSSGKCEAWGAHLYFCLSLQSV